MTIEFWKDKTNLMESAIVKALKEYGCAPFPIKVQVNEALQMSGLNPMDCTRPECGEIGYIIGTKNYSREDAKKDGFRVLDNL